MAGWLGHGGYGFRAYLNAFKFVLVLSRPSYVQSAHFETLNQNAAW
jgi:hypothetical protein